MFRRPVEERRNYGQRVRQELPHSVTTQLTGHETLADFSYWTMTEFLFRSGAITVEFKLRFG